LEMVLLAAPMSACSDILPARGTQNSAISLVPSSSSLARQPAPHAVLESRTVSDSSRCQGRSSAHSSVLLWRDSFRAYGQVPE
jgi:hypothetical protein